MSAPLDLIPVLDLMDGQVVRAVAGRRDAYRPLQSALCDSSRPEAVVDGLLALYPFRRIYIADLGAILGRRDHREVVAGLQRSHPELEFWVDGGFTEAADAQAWQDAAGGRPVLGSESLARLPERDAWPAKSVLSLDFRGEDLLGSPALLLHPERWPAEVIVMTLARVGMDAGPDLARLAQLQRLNPVCRMYAAGGVRHADDLAALAEAGAAGVLLASALHDGRLSRAELGVFHAGHPTSAASGATANGPAPDR
jgi:phosphoribosylformimino-5-aminoimidazole carboxamide ribotide isomerase